MEKEGLDRKKTASCIALTAVRKMMQASRSAFCAFKAQSSPSTPRASTSEGGGEENRFAAHVTWFFASMIQTSLPLCCSVSV